MDKMDKMAIKTFVISIILVTAIIVYACIYAIIK